jgi:hypothetical protein
MKSLNKKHFCRSALSISSVVRAERILRNCVASIKVNFSVLLLVFELLITRCARPMRVRRSTQTNKIRYPKISYFIGAGGENRTLIVCLEGRHISHYTTPANVTYYSIFYYQATSVKITKLRYSWRI